MPKFRWNVRALWATLRNNWPWKVAALAVALVVFLTIRQSTSYTQTLTLPVELEMEEGATAIPSVEPGVVDITFRGSEEAIRQLSVPGAERPRVRVRPERPQDGNKTLNFHLSRSDVSCPAGLRVASIEQTELTVTFSPREERTFRVAKPEVIGLPAFTEAKVYIKPEEVLVSGPSALFEEIDPHRPLRTELMDVANLSSDKTAMLRVLPPDERSGWTVHPERVRAEVILQRENGARIFTEVPVRVLQSASGARYVPDATTVEVTARGISSELETIDPAGVVALVMERPNGLPCEPQIIFPSSNRVNSVVVRPPLVRLLPEPQSQESEP